jgi:predicted ATPase
MFLRRLDFKNVRCLKDLSLDFSNSTGGIRKWTFILGENGTGKSTIIRGAGLVTCGSDSLAEVLGDPRYWITEGQERCQISAVIETKTNEQRELRIEFGKNDSLSEIISRNVETLAPIDDALKHTSRNYFVAGYGASRRLSSHDERRAKTSGYRHIRAQSIATLFDSDATLNPLESWAMDMDYRRGEEGITTVRKVLSNFLPGMRFDSIDRDSGRLLFKTVDGIVPLQYLSDGYQNVAAWVGDLLFRISEAFDDYKSPLKARGLLIIDEVDLHLHPIWQRSLHTFLTKKLPNLQLLVTTHSAITAQQANENELNYLVRERKRINLRTFKDDPSKLLVSQLLMSDIFGLETDEALPVEKKKNRYRQLRDKSPIGTKEKDELERLKDELLSLPQAGVSNLTLHKEQIELMKKIQTELRGGEDDPIITSS